MTFHVWWLFLMTVSFISAIPGPNMLHALSRSVTFGFRRSVVAMLGCLSALFLALVLSALGVGAILAAMPRLFNAIRYVGAAYLIYLGVRAWRSDDRPSNTEIDSLMTFHVRLIDLYRTGFLVGISNPKLLLFAAAFFPQFVDHRKPVFPQFAILVVTYLCSDGVWLALYGLGGRSLSRLLGRQPVRRAFNRLTALVFVAFGFVVLRARV